MSAREKFYITTAISYPNGVPHIGHAYEAIATDAIARFERLDGKDVFFLTGTDEHGLKMKQTAVKEGADARARSPTATRRASSRWSKCSASPTTISSARPKPRHYEASAEIWRRMEKAGDIFKKKYGGWYSTRQEAYCNETETDRRCDGERHETAERHARRVDGGRDVLLPAFGSIRIKLLALYEAVPRFHSADRTPQRDRQLRQRRARGSLDFAFDVGLGNPGSRCASNT